MRQTLRLDLNLSFLVLALPPRGLLPFPWKGQLHEEGAGEAPQSCGGRGAWPGAQGVAHGAIEADTSVSVSRFLNPRAPRTRVTGALST